MREIVAGDPDGPLGELCEPSDPRSIGGAIRRILDLTDGERAELGRRCRRAAVARWNWEAEASRLIELYRELEVAPL
jgi:glycosyltransferase involved in cell wall biosynthesis